MKKLSLALISCLVANLIATAQYQSDYFYSPIRVQNPSNWKSDNGKITKTALSVTPKGLYSQIDVEMTFAAYNPAFFGNDTLELSFDFNLPASSFMIDSWLWINEVPRQALLLDYGSATTTYEGIVKRRKDPSILTTWGGGYYSLKIYPMKATETRKVKLSYMVLNNWTLDHIYVPLPINLIGGAYGMDKVVPNNIALNVNEVGNFKNAKLSQNATRTVFSDDMNYKMQFSPLDDFTLVFDSPLKNGIYAKSFETGSQGYFEMAFLPSQLLDLTGSGNFTHFDLHTSLTNGITFDKTYLGSDVDSPNAEVPILQLGSYKGDGSITFTTAGELENTIYSKTTTIDLGLGSDTTVRKVWANSKIAKLQSSLYGYYSYQDSTKHQKVLKEIMKLSLDNRILNQQTAFLALEPGMEVVKCNNCYNFYYPYMSQSLMATDMVSSNSSGFAPSIDKNNSLSQVIPVSQNKFDVTINLTKNTLFEGEKNAFSENQISVYPNPTNGKVKIDFSAAKIDFGATKVDIFNAYGTQVKTLNIQVGKGVNAIEVDLTKENLASGVYRIIITSVDNNISVVKNIIIP